MVEPKHIDNDNDYEDDDGEDAYKEELLTSPGVIDKYQNAATIANTVLGLVIKKCVPKASIVEICQFGDKEIEKELSKVYSKKKIEKGIAFPTCVSVNEICGHYSP